MSTQSTISNKQSGGWTIWQFCFGLLWVTGWKLWRNISETQEQWMQLSSLTFLKCSKEPDREFILISAIDSDVISAPYPDLWCINWEVFGPKHLFTTLSWTLEALCEWILPCLRNLELTPKTCSSPYNRSTIGTSCHCWHGFTQRPLLRVYQTAYADDSLSSNICTTTPPTHTHTHTQRNCPQLGNRKRDSFEPQSMFSLIRLSHASNRIIHALRKHHSCTWISLVALGLTELLLTLRFCLNLTSIVFPHSRVYPLTFCMRLMRSVTVRVLHWADRHCGRPLYRQ
jgi:hypothetical protein